ncbi:hypothetical protein LTR20_005987 [Exophiala xenobiotica]|nr:hypothetical protein LTS13_003042 [Exophiala xenobiotica]KAK5396036.1 hypothetical protein LTR79_006790 [Exophiala xenobiotica]KAK5423989.1 hypothetical protein LTR90_001335 [Exophiala xenobiotica]KAK5462038.1 hypothetical protein LTR20_005987 [Exophiala xenobiotica]KAK5479792.1 hypothetical protein LTR26_007645 [Exophiala xenobiotica]
MPPRVRRNNRPVKRNLVRWTDDLDKDVLLCVQYVCVEAGIKIPWARVAEVMGPHFTEGAIVQHLAKLRNLMDYHKIPVPPPLKRGMVTRTPSKVYANANNKRTFEPIPPLYAASPNAATSEYRSVYDRVQTIKPEDTGSPVPKAKARVRNTGRRRTMSEEDDDNEALPEDLYDSEEGTPKKRRRTTKPKRSVANNDNPPSTPPQQAINVKTESSGTIEGSAGPARRTRGIKHNYELMDPMFDDADADADADEDDVAADAEDEGEVSSADDNTEMRDQEVTTSSLAASDVDMMGSGNIRMQPQPYAEAFDQANGCNGIGDTNIGAPAFAWPTAAHMYGSPIGVPNPGILNGNVLHGQHGLAFNDHMGSNPFYGTVQLPFPPAPMSMGPPDLRSYSFDSSYQPSRNNSVATGTTSFTSMSESDRTTGNLRYMPEIAAQDVVNQNDFAFDPQDVDTTMPSGDAIWSDIFNDRDAKDFANSGI